MILPSKHITETQALIGVGAELLHHLERAQTVTSLWDFVRANPVVGTFERFVLALDFLYITGVVSMKKGLLTRSVYAS